MRQGRLKLNDRGVAMMVCITIIAILMIFCFSLLAVSYSLYSSQNNSMQEEKNSEAAKSLDLALREELTSGSEDSFLNKYLRFNIVAGQDALVNTKGETWPHYDPDLAEHDASYAKRYFTLEKTDGVSINGFPSRTSVCMWWTLDKAENDENEIVHLFVETECVSGSQSYVITSEYELSERSGKPSTYNPASEQREVNPADNRINRKYIWYWKYLGSE